MSATIARPRGHRWPGRIDVLPFDEHQAHLDHASDGAQALPNGADYSWLRERPGILDAVREDELCAVMEATS